MERNLPSRLIPNPWWNSARVVGPAIGAVGLALGTVLGWYTYRLRYGPPFVPNCDELAPGGREVSGTVGGVQYWEAMRGGADPEEEVPMVIAFHSLCAAPQGLLSMFKNIGRARLIVPAGTGLCRSGSASARRWWKLGPTAAMRNDAAKLPEATGQWQAEADRMANFISQIQKCRPTKGKPILTGSSMGGEMTLLLASTHPRLVDSGVAVSSYVLPPFWNKRMAPTAMIHGDGDTTVKFTWAKDYAERMIAEGARLSFDQFPSTGHAITKDMGRAWGGALKSQVAILGGEAAVA